MGYRLYLTSDTAPISPTAEAGWEDATQVTRGLLGHAKAGTNAAWSATETSASGTHDVLIGQWSSRPMSHAGTLNIAYNTLVVATLESNAAANFTTRWVVRVLSSDGLTIRGERVFAHANEEWDTAVSAEQEELLDASQTVSCEVGDRLVVEYGYRTNNTSASSFTGTIRAGGTAATDLQDEDTTTNATTRSPWIEFLDDRVVALFADPDPPAGLRLYLTASAAPITTPADSIWNDAAGITRGLLSPTKGGANAALSRAETNVAADFDVLLGQWTSAPITSARTLTGGFRYVIAANESDAAANMFVRTTVRVVSNDGSVDRGIFYDFVETGEGELSTTLTASSYTADPTDVDCQVGDRIVVEIGYQADNTVTDSFTGTIRHGGTDTTDLAPGDVGAEATTRSPWVEFDDPDAALLFIDATGVSAWEGTIDGLLAVQAAFGADLAADHASWGWTEITSDVRYSAGIELVHGRGDEASESQPASCSLVLDNRAGAYSLGPQSSNYPYIRRGTPIRVLADVDDGNGWRVLFWGAADSWQPDWAGGPTGDAVVALTASGALRRLEQGQSPVTSVLTRSIAANTATVAHWPCEDSANSDAATSAIEGAPPMQYTGAVPTFGADSGQLVCTASLVNLNGARLVGEVPAYDITTEQCVRFLMSSTSAQPDDSVLCRVYCPGGSAPLWEILNGAADGSIELNVYDTTGTLVEDTLEFTFDLTDGPFMVSLEMTQIGANIDWALRVRQVGMPGTRSTTDSIIGETFGPVSYVEFGPNGDLDSLSIGQVHVQTSIVSLVSAETSEQVNAYRFETVDDRLQRLCDENSVVLDLAGSTLVRMGPQRVATLLELLRECEATDQGVLYDGVGPGLRYACHNTRVSQPADMTLDASVGEVDGLIPIDDDQRTRNLIVASRPNGGSAVAADVTGPMGTQVIGIYDDSVSVSPEGDALLPDYASWFVHVGTVGGGVSYRYPSLALQLHRDPNLAGAWATSASQVGDRIDVTNIEDVRTQHPSGTISLMLEGYRQRIDQFTWFVELACSPYEPFIAAVVPAASGDTDEHVWRLESDGATLTSAVTAGASSFEVTTPFGPAWTTVADDFPLYVEVEGDRIEVTAVTGTSSPQTFTVTAATVVRNLSAGAAVTLWRQPVLALPI